MVGAQWMGMRPRAQVAPLSPPPMDSQWPHCPRESPHVSRPVWPVPCPSSASSVSLLTPGHRERPVVTFLSWVLLFRPHPFAHAVPAGTPSLSLGLPFLQSLPWPWQQERKATSGVTESWKNWNLSHSNPKILLVSFWPHKSRHCSTAPRHWIEN